ncbi:MAG: hypothetical protein QM767_08345 [Anaeromyxobacter sp.]
MSHADRVRLADTPPPADLPADIARVWCRLAPLVDAGGVTVLRRHVPFAYRALAESVALHARHRKPLTNDIVWLRTFGITAQQVAAVL